MVPLLVPLLGSVAAKAGDALVRELLRAWGLDKARRKLERHLAAVQSILLDADTKSRTNPAVHRWITDLKTAAYQADDVLDEFRYEALRRRATTQIHRPSISRKVLSYFTTNSPIVFRLSMSRKMKDALEMIDELVREMNKFQFLQHVEAPNIVHPQTHSHVVESEIVGRQNEKEQVVQILLRHSDNNNNNNNNFMVLPIVGMGGIGKTTLAQLVYNDQRVKHHFELILWACVSNKFVIEEIIRSVIEVATMMKCDLTQVEALQKELCRVLGKKRYLLVLDDVWNEDGQKWDAMRLLFNSHAGSGSVIIVTSRNDQVASIMGTLPPHRILLLDEDQSWELFERNAFGREVEKQNELISVAKSIVHKCKGLPLAIKTIATLLRSKKNHSEWSSVLNSDIWKNDILTPTGILPALQLSFDYLSSEAKTCFSLCAIFRKDSLMDKDMLIQLWMANDFIASETRGQQIFDVLVWRCFLQDVKIENNVLSKYQDKFIHQSTICKMHDLMHDLANSVSGKACSILQESSSHQESLPGSQDASSLHREVRHLSLDHVSNNTIAAMKGILAPSPRTILVKRGNMDRSKFMSLRALKTTSIKTHMTNLKHLRYLDCSYSSISALPEATTMLYSLQTLRLTGCRKLKKLPEGMRYMISLRHIFLIGCHRLEHMPQGIGQMNSLMTMTNYVIDSDAGRGIDQLQDLNLGGALSLTELTNVHSAENAKQGNMSAKHNLKRLSLDWYGPYSTHVGYEVHGAEEILEALRPPKRLEGLLLSNYSGAKFSSWMNKSTLLEHLSELSMSDCKNCKDLPPLWQLPSLGYLSLNGLRSLTSLCVGYDDTYTRESCTSPSPFFPKLETMIISNMPKLERWHQEVAREVATVSFPRLKKLNISGCPMLGSMPAILPLLEDLLVKDATYIPLYHLMNLSVQSNLECKGDISVEPIVGWLPIGDLHFQRLGHSEVSLKLKGLMDNVEHLEEELNRVPCRFIKNMEMTNCDCFFSSEPSQIQRQIGNHFCFVEKLWITGSNNIVQWPAIEFRNLNCLRHLRFSGCSNLTGSLPPTISDDEYDILPRLQHLTIIDCENLLEVPKLPESLEILYINRCRKLVSMPTILGNIKKLRLLGVYGCDALTTFPDEMYGVIALKKVRMERCPRLATLPEGLLQQLPALKKLRVRGCPNLEEACSRGGAYWDLVQAIPKRLVGSQ
uniref:NBS-LRR disease resistance protein n=1 Tax=Dasypyrum villosum TaxID=40247 RepID=A0A8K1IAI2_9POAL|nr:NBS-LRR disease resistance protein [Dasypyrum villosum]